MAKQLARGVRIEALGAGDDWRAFHKEKAAFLLHLAEFLPPDDRGLIEAVFVHQHSLTDLAELLHQPRFRLYHRIRNLLRRLATPAFQAVVRHRRTLTRRERLLAQLWIVEARSVRELSADFGGTTHGIRQAQSALVVRLLRLERQTKGTSGMVQPA
jgi:hypothetical protein